MTIRNVWSVWLIGLGMVACSSPGNESVETDTGASPWFREVSESVGLEFTHVRAEQIRYYFPEIMSGGAAWIDYDLDGYLDLYLVQGGSPGGDGALNYGNQLFKNHGGSRFEDVTSEAGVGNTGYGMGVAVGDYDNDGDPDLYVTNVGPNVLYRNEGSGRFVEVTEEAGVGHSGWGSSAVFSDYDRDGDLDLYVVNYIHWSPDREMECFSGGAGRDYCHPDNYRAPATDVLYRNEGNGTFQDVTGAAGIGGAVANGLGVVTGDFNGDGWQDFYVANDGNPNHLWLNEGDGRFSENASMKGVAVNRQGMPEAGMGVIAFDHEQDGDLDIFLAHLRGETNTLYVNQGALFQDATAVSGLASTGIPFTGFGAGYFDFNNDGFGDLFVVNGRVGQSGVEAVDGDPFAEPNLLFMGNEAHVFSEVKPRGGTLPELSDVSRAAAFADFDRDGDMDIAIVNNGSKVHLLQNAAGDGNNWLGLELSNEYGSPLYGARVSVHAGNHTWWRRVQPGGSYQASSDPAILVGLGRIAAVDSVIVYGAGRDPVRYDALAVNTYHRLDPFDP